MTHNPIYIPLVKTNTPGDFTIGSNLTVSGSASIAGAETVGGNVTIGANGTSTTFTKIGNTAGDQTTIGTSSVVSVTRSSASSQCFNAQISGDTQPRIATNSSGVITFGSGSATGDTNLYRQSANLLQTDDSLTLSGATSNLTVSGSAAITGNLSVTGVGQKQFVQATADQAITSVTPSQTASTFLLLPVVANAKYIVKAGVIWTNTTGVTAPSWTGPASATMKWNNTTASSDYSSTIGATNGTFASLGTSRMVFFEGLLQVAGTAGNLTFTLSTTTGTVNLLTDSYLTLERVA